MNSLELKDKKAQLKNRAFEMIEQCEVEIRNFTKEEQDEYDSIKKQIKNINGELKELERSLLNSPEEIKSIKSNIKKINSTMEKRFSLVNAINSIAKNQLMDDVTTAVSDAGKEEMRKSGLAMGGQIQLPMSVQAGARFLTGLVGDVQIPVMSASNVGWTGETSAAADGAPAFSHVTLSPKRLTAYIDVSKQLLVQDAIGVEQMIRQDIVNAINSKLEATILGAAAGSSTQPAGIFNGATYKTITDMESIAELESDVEAANVLGECKYIVNPKAKAALRAKSKGENVAESLYSHGEIDGTPALSTSHVAENKLVYGDFSNLAIGQWGPIDLVVDNYTQAVNGCVRLVINAYFDAKVLREEAFAYGQTAE